LAYLRFTPEEHRALCQACRDLDLRGGFPALRERLVQALREPWPDLAARVAGFRKAHLRLLLDHLKAQQRGPGPAAEGAEGGLSFEELQEVAAAAHRFLLYDGRACAFQGFLVHHFKGTSPALARKLDRLSERQVKELYDRVQRPTRGRP
jgi:hypothetical protein